jgi:hypothetical protein
LESETGEVQGGWEAGLRQLKERVVQEVKAELQTLKDSLRPMQVKLDGVPRLPLAKVEIPMKAPKSLEGSISYLTKKHGGNVHEKGIVTMASKSVYYRRYGAPKSVADLTSGSGFRSKHEPGQ